MAEKFASDRETMVMQLMKNNVEFRKLFRDHQSLESRLEELNRHLHWNEEEETERKRIQKMKLRAKDRMEVILRDQQL